MMQTAQQLPSHTARCGELLAEVVTEVSSGLTEPAVSIPIAEPAFQDKYSAIQAYLESLTFDYRIDPPAGSDEESAAVGAEIQAFNDELDAKTRNFVVSRAIDAVLCTLLSEIVDKYAAETSVETPVFNSLSVLLDFVAYVVVHEDKDLKKSLYSSLAKTVSILLSVSDALHVFWEYFESRLLIIQSSIFDRAVVGDRISILEICNPITDQFYVKNDKKFNSYKKDSFNDKLHARVRLFVNTLFSLEDNTGLNKFFSTANRSVQIELSRKTRDNFMADIVECHRIFNDPYLYLKQGRAGLNKVSQVFNRVYDQLVDLETKDLKRLPKVEPHAVSHKPKDADRAYLAEKYAKKLYVPEHYWTTGFNKDAPEKDIQEAQQLHYDMFEASAVRRYYLVAIYIVANLYYELKAQQKRELLKAFGCPPGTKHIMDDTTPDVASKAFIAIRRDLPKTFKLIDAQFMYILQHLAVVEEYWYGWLIYGKDPKTNTPLLADKVVQQLTLDAVASKFPTINAVKEKRYFNVYATPQLSRKMKTPTGLLNVKITRFTPEALAAAASDSMDTEEHRTLLKWRQLRFSRQHKWLEFDALLDDAVLPTDQNLRPKLAPPAPEKPNEAAPTDHEAPQPADEKPAAKRVKLQREE